MLLLCFRLFAGGDQGYVSKYANVIFLGGGGKFCILYRLSTLYFQKKTSLRNSCGRIPPPEKSPNKKPVLSVSPTWWAVSPTWSGHPNISPTFLRALGHCLLRPKEAQQGQAARCFESLQGPPVFSVGEFWWISPRKFETWLVGWLVGWLGLG